MMTMVMMHKNNGFCKNSVAKAVWISVAGNFDHCLCFQSIFSIAYSSNSQYVAFTFCCKLQVSCHCCQDAGKNDANVVHHFLFVDDDNYACTFFAQPSSSSSVTTDDKEEEADNNDKDGPSAVQHDNNHLNWPMVEEMPSEKMDND